MLNTHTQTSKQAYKRRHSYRNHNSKLGCSADFFPSFFLSLFWVLIRHCRTMWWRHHFAHENFDISHAGRWIVRPKCVRIKYYLMLLALACNILPPHLAIFLQTYWNYSIGCISFVRKISHAIDTCGQLFAMPNEIHLKSNSNESLIEEFTSHMCDE